jgi:hypothetical protein
MPWRFGRSLVKIKPMINSIVRGACSALLLLVVTSCAWAQEGDKAVDVPAATQISLAPVLPPEKFAVVNRGSGLGFAFTMLGGVIGAHTAVEMEKSRSSDFRALLSDKAPSFSEQVTVALQKTFADAGRPLLPLLEVKYDPAEPRELDYKAIRSSTDLILVVNIKEVILLSTTFSTQYVPRLIISFELVNKSTGDAGYSEDVQYGGGVKKMTETEIPSDSQFAWDDYDAVLRNRDQVEESFRQGIQLIARQAAQQILSSQK